MYSWYEMCERASKEDYVSAIGKLSKSAEHILPGTYLNGLLTVLSIKDGKSMLHSWNDALGEIVCVSITGLGDAFYWNKSKKSIYFLNAQYGTYTFIDNEIDWFMFDFLKKPEVLKEVLHESLFNKVLKNSGKLIYGECFFPVPYLISGGGGRMEDYKKGDAEVYFSLIGKTIGMDKVTTND